MGKFRFNLALIFFIFLLPSVSSEIEIDLEASEIYYMAPSIAFIDAGTNVTFNAIGIENTTSILWDFGRNISGPDTRYSNLTVIEHTVHASGRYNVTLTANYENGDSIVKELVLIVFYVSNEIEIKLEASEIDYGAPGNAFIDAEENVTFNVTGAEDAVSVLWDFGRDISGPNTRYSNLTTVSHIVHAEGRYDIIFTALYGDGNYEIRESTLFVNYEGDEQVSIVNNEALFFAIAGSEITMSLVLGYWTQQIRKEKVYL